jgi:hypothetical protein
MMKPSAATEMGRAKDEVKAKAKAKATARTGVGNRKRWADRRLMALLLMAHVAVGQLEVETPRGPCRFRGAKGGVLRIA